MDTQVICVCSRPLANWRDPKSLASWRKVCESLCLF